MIKLVKTSKKTKKTKIETFETFEELEKRLIKLSSAHYEINDFNITSDNFKEMVEFFKKMYNPNYFLVDGLVECITINRLNVGEKRKKIFKKKKQSKKVYIDKAIKRLQKKYDINYDEDLNLLELNHDSNKIIFELNEEEVKLENVSINGAKIEDIKETTKIAKEITKYFNKLSQRIK